MSDDDRTEVGPILYQIATLVHLEVADRDLDADAIVAFTDDVVGRFDFDNKQPVMAIYRTVVDLPCGRLAPLPLTRSTPSLAKRSTGRYDGRP